VVKGCQQKNRRVVINEQIVGRIANQLAMPVGNVNLVEIPDELIQIEPDLQHMPAGIAHGSRMILGVTEREGIKYVNSDDNRMRFSELAVLYGWLQASDHQFFFEKQQPHRVYSLDHGHFFPGSH
jgi:hypothetical protein